MNHLRTYRTALSSLCLVRMLTTTSLLLLASLINPSSSMVLSSWPSTSTSQHASSLTVPSRPLMSVPTVRLTSSTQGINGVYSARDPKSIPKGFVRMCGKAGGFAPKPLWDDLTNGITPWYENEKEGYYMYFNCNDSHWWIDDASGYGLFLAVPDGSLLLPPTKGWVSLTGRRAGAPTASFF